MTRTEAKKIINLLEKGYVFIHKTEGAEWGMEYRVPDVVLWKRFGRGERGGYTEKIHTEDQIIHYLSQYHFGEIFRGLRAIL